MAADLSGLTSFITGKNLPDIIGGATPDGASTSAPGGAALPQSVAANGPTAANHSERPAATKKAASPTPTKAGKVGTSGDDPNTTADDLAGTIRPEFITSSGGAYTLHASIHNAVPNATINWNVSVNTNDNNVMSRGTAHASAGGVAEWDVVWYSGRAYDATGGSPNRGFSVNVDDGGPHLLSLGFLVTIADGAPDPAQWAR
ncbi:hypothetical protein [Dactylosporangium sp. NPDC049140]|uniref:hypothetical protein n=1 Tax=Dactylosporangium sp. NPDC049140 TaxID=3155647 RepID=UPI0033D13DA9